MNKKLALMTACCAIIGLSACSEPILPDCTEGERKCQNNAIVICESGRFSVEKTCEGATPLCDPATLTCAGVQQDCVSGTRLCYGGDVRACTDGQWKLNPCSGGTVCDAATTECRARLCTDGSYKCDNNTLYVCGSEQWLISEACDETRLCDAGRGVCAIKVPCQNDEPVCVGGNAVNCANGVRTTTVCSNSQICVVGGGNASCVAKVCDEGAFICNERGREERCVNNVWIESVCTEGKICADALGCVTKVCDEGATRCLNNAVTACVNNAWTNGEACGARTCLVQNNAASCVVKNCDHGSRRCNGSVVESCGASLQWEEARRCSESQICQEASGSADCQALVCKTNDLRCNGNTLETCAANAWTTLQVCSATTGFICVPGKAAEGSVPAIAPTCARKVCDESTTKCNGNQLDTCTRNAWVTSTCTNIGGQAARCATSGTPSVAQCAVKVCDDGPLCVGNAAARCSNNTIQGSTNCGTGQACRVEGGEANCYRVPDCGDNIVDKGIGETCDGANLDGQTCRTVLGNDKAQGVLQCYPKGHASQCRFNTSQCHICGNGIIEVNEECDGTNLGGAVCGAGLVGTVKCTADCKLDKSGCTAACTGNICSAGKIQVCSAGVLGAATTCPGGADCKSATECGECKENAFECTATGYKLCISGTWVPETCKTGWTCNATTKSCIECTENVFECTATGYRICISGTWVPDTCKSDEVCLVDVGCVDCLTIGEKRCLDSDMAVICDKDHTWDITELCGTGRVCSEGACVTNYNINHASTLGYDPPNRIMWGELYSVDRPAGGSLAPAPEMKAQIVCTTNIANALSTWTIAANAAFTGKWTGTGNNNYEFSGEIAAAASDRHCLMRFSGNNGATWKYAASLASGGGILSGTTATNSQAYFVAGSGALKYELTETFETLTFSGTGSTYSYTSSAAYSANGGTQALSVRALRERWAQNGNTWAIAMTANTDHPSFIKVEGLNAGVGTISFDCGDYASADPRQAEVSVGNAGGVLAKQTLELSTCAVHTSTTTTSWVKSFTFGQAGATYFEIKPIAPTSGPPNNNWSRFRLDNLSWTSAY